ncbi:hypothetical protein [Cohaesibacter celericrescens]|uniref:Uncharacterized protein n=1 Tax=Cohaesibacter celericrescens TaxID=2067669 RepID=A0A2N5XJZ9_9HYPH|nr:hypothetical protein [Cohaesibacter celericrescens]PLW74804.1 hypothetical protein C0081_22970 [Cohaesibacter celericrescens]
MKPLDASNLGYMLDNGDQLFVVCNNGVCSHGAELIVPWLIDLLGRDHSSLAVDIIAGLKKHRKRLRCARCGNYDVGFQRIHAGYTGHRTED